MGGGIAVKFDQTQWDENLFWLKCLCTGQGLYCPGCPGFLMDGMVKPICYNQSLCCESACGLREGGKYAGCICDPIADFWCADRCCCLKNYCALPVQRRRYGMRRPHRSDQNAPARARVCVPLHPEIVRSVQRFNAQVLPRSNV